MKQARDTKTNNYSYLNDEVVCGGGTNRNLVLTPLY